jgi:hypothetical protein
LIISVTLVYWTTQANTEGALEEKAGMIVTSKRGMEEGASDVTRKMDASQTSDNPSLWFFGTLIVSLLLLFGLSFRYYSHREITQAEKRWRTACESFLTRMEVERMASEEKQNGTGCDWTHILNGGRNQVKKKTGHMAKRT